MRAHTYIAFKDLTTGGRLFFNMYAFLGWSKIYVILFRDRKQMRPKCAQAAITWALIRTHTAGRRIPTACFPNKRFKSVGNCIEIKKSRFNPEYNKMVTTCFGETPYSSYT